MTTKPNKTSSFKFTLFKWSAIILLLGFITYPILQVLVVFFGEVNQKLRARVFMVYRVKYADPMMLSGRYKNIKKNAYPSDEKRDKFNKIAQEGDNAVLTKFPYPEHFAREPEWNFTLADDVYYLLWNIRLNVCKYYKAHEQENKLNLVVPAKDAKVDRYFRQDPKMTDEDYKKLFTGVDDKNKKGWGVASVKFCDLVISLIDKPEELKVEDKKVSDKLEKMIMAFVDCLGYDKKRQEEIKQMIPDFFIKYGEAYPTVFQSTIYSRCFYYFIFLISNGDFDFSEIEIRPEMKIEEWNKETMIVLANTFAQIFSRVFPESWKYELTDPSFKEKLTKWLGPKQNIEGIKDQEENIKKVRELLVKNRELLKQVYPAAAA